MPAQTTKKSYVYFPDGCKVEYSTDGTTYVDMGATNSAALATLEYDTNQVITANAGTLDRQAKNLRMTGGVTLINLNPTDIAAISGGLMTSTDTPTTPVTTSPDQVISSGSYTDVTPVNLIILTSSSDSTPLKATAEPTLTSVTGSVDGALAADDDYWIIKDSSSFSGYSIVFNVAGGTTLTTVVQDMTIVFSSTTPAEKTTIQCGASTIIMQSRYLRFTHTDDNGLTRTLTMFAADIDSGGFQFNYKGANEDGVEEMPITFTAQIDTSRSSGAQLFEYAVEAGAA